MKKLFIETCEFEKRAYDTYLGRESSQWVREIISTFLEDYPFMQDIPLTVSWHKKDDAKGYAVGSLNIMDGSVPVIVKDWQFSPLDVIILPDVGSYPISAQLLLELIENPTPFKDITPTKPKSNLAIFGDMNSMQYSPINSYQSLDGSQSTIRDAVKVGSFIDKVENVDAGSIAEVLTKIASDPSIIAGFKKNDNMDVVEKLAGKKHASNTSILESFVRNLEIDRQYVYKDDIGNYRVKQANSGVDYVWETEINEEEAKKLAKKTCKRGKKGKKGKKYTKLANSYEIFGKEGNFYINEDKDWHIFDSGVIKTAENADISGDSVDIGAKGIWKVGNKVTMPFEILSMEKVGGDDGYATFNLLSRDGAIYIDKDNNWTIDDKFDMHEKTSGIHCNFNGATMPKVGEFGVFILENGATSPVTITGMQKSGEVDDWRISVSDGLRNMVFIPSKYNFGDLEPSETEKGAFFLPSQNAFVKLEQNLEKTASSKAELAKKVRDSVSDGVVRVEAFDGVEKVSFLLSRDNKDVIDMNSSGDYIIPQNANFIKLGQSLNVTMDVLSLETQSNCVSVDDIGLYNVSGPDFDKYAELHDVRDLSKDEAVWTLISTNVDDVDIAAVEKLGAGESVKLASSIKTPKNINDVYDAIKDSFDKLAGDIDILAVDLIKEASVLNDKNTVDAVLSLGLLKKHNVAEYLAMLPQYKICLSEISKLLTTTRLGLTQMPEDAVKRALDGVNGIVIILEQILASMKKVK